MLSFIEYNYKVSSQYVLMFIPRTHIVQHDLLTESSASKKKGG
jgi:hypothetical protein